MIRIYVLFLLAVMISSCSVKYEEMDEWEKQLAEDLKAKDVELSHNSTSTTTNGKLTNSEIYLQVKIIDSEVLDEISHNKRILNLKCDEIKDKILLLEKNASIPIFNNLKIVFSKEMGFLFFKNEKVTTVTYKLH